MINSLVPDDMISAYRSTNYRVFSDDPFVLRMGQPSGGLLRLHDLYRCNSSAFITAYNPFSLAASKVENENAQLKLENHLIERSFSCIKGIGEDSVGDWPSENSVLVLGIEFKMARSIGTAFLQNAIVWSSADAIPKLILLR